MTDSQIPWWMLILLGICVAGLAVWQSSRIKPALRLGGVALSLIYIALLAFVIGGDPRNATPVRTWPRSEIVSAVLSSGSLFSAIALSGRISPSGQLFWFILFTAFNATLAFTSGSFVVGAILVILALICSVLLFQACRITEQFSWTDLWQPIDSQGESVSQISWLAGSTGMLFSLLLIGGTCYALQAESTRAIHTRRHSALPSRSRINAVLKSTDQSPQSSRGELLVQRTDAVILIVVAGFASLFSLSAKLRSDDDQFISACPDQSLPGVE